MSASLLLSASLSLSLGAGTGIDRSEKLNAPLDYELVVGDVSEFRVTPGGDWVVYRGQQESSRYELYAMRSDRSLGPVRVNAPGHAVMGFEIHGPRVVYRTTQDLFVVGLDLVPIQLNAPLPADRRVEDFEAFGSRVLFRVEHPFGVLGVHQLFSVPIAGGTAVPLTPQPTSSFRDNVVAYLVTPDRTQVIALATLQDRAELFRIPIDGGVPPAPLCGSFVNGGNVFEHLFAMSPHGTRVVYGADQLADTRLELFSVPVDGSALPVRLNAELPTGGDLFELAIDPLGGRVVYRADQTVDGRHDLLVVPIDGSAPPLTLATGLASVSFFVSPMGNRAVFRGDQLYSVALDGSQAPTQLSDFVAGESAVEVAITADSSRVVYRGTRTALGVTLYSAPLAGGAPPVELSRPLGPAEEVASFCLSPGGQTVVYEVGIKGGTVGLHAVPVNGPAPGLELTDALVPPARVENDYVVEGTRAFFRGNLAQADSFELHAVPLDASEPALVLNDPLATEVFVADVDGYCQSPDGKWAVYATRVSVVSVSLGPEPTVRTLVGPESGWLGFEDLSVSADSSRVVFRADNQDVGSHVFLAPVDGSAPAIQLSTGVFPAGFGADGPRLSPDGEWCLYGLNSYFGLSGMQVVRTDGSGTMPPLFSGFDVQFTAGGEQLVHRSGGHNGYSFEPMLLQVRPTDGSSAPIVLAPDPPDEQASIAQYEIGANEERAVYLCDQEGPFELFSVPLDGSATPLRISDALAPDRDVAPGFVLTPDGTRAVYAADRDENEANELYVAAIVGGAAPLELSGPMVASGDVAFSDDGPSLVGEPLVQITDDSSWLTYVADQEVDERFELYAVPLDRSQLPVKLNAPLVAGGDVSRSASGVRISPDGSRIVYLADQEQDERFGLWSAPLDGSGPVVPLAGVLEPEADVRPGFVILASEDSVLFLADLAVNEQVELWLAPLDGSRPSTRRSALSHVNADVQTDFQLDPDERHVLYRADEDEDELVELFRFPIRRVPHHLKR